MTAGDLIGRTAFVTGAARNIGRSIAIALARSGADVVLHARSQSSDLEATEAQVRAEGRNAWSYAADFESPDALKALVNVVNDQHEISILVNNAAIRPSSRSEAITSDDWNRVLRVNLTAPFELVQAFAPRMRELSWGRIINIGGQDSYWGWGGRAHVVTSKAGLAGLTRCLAVELGKDRITVNQVVPGLIATTRDGSNYSDWQRVVKRLTAVMAIKNLGTAEDVAAAVAFLSSSTAGYITGQELHVNGGGFPLLLDPREWSAE